MVKLTPDIFEISPQFTNPIRDRELDLRGYFFEFIYLIQHNIPTIIELINYYIYF